MKRPTLLLALSGLSLLFGCAHSSGVKGSSLPSETKEDSAESSLSHQEHVIHNDPLSPEAYAYGRNLFDHYLQHDEAFELTAHTGRGHSFFPSRGVGKLLVVPLLFLGDNYSSSVLSKDKEALNKAFFGEAEETSWQSVRSYYWASSYGALDIQGEVADPISLNYTFSLAESKESEDGSNYYNELLEDVYDRLFTKEGAPYQGKASEFDGNGDGVIDGLYLIPISPEVRSSLTGRLHWAFTYEHTFASEEYRKAHPEYGQIGTYGYSPFAFLTRVKSEGGTLDRPDAHTFIHEMGHQLGQYDYYDAYESTSKAAGGAMMMDRNIGDEDPYTKYLFGWSTPIILTDASKEEKIDITLKPSGEGAEQFVVLASDFNNTAMDEYLILEYYQPSHLNEHDAAHYYENQGQQMPTEEGIRLFHVNRNLYSSRAILSRDGKTVNYDFDCNPAHTLNTLGEEKDFAFPEDVDSSREGTQYYHSYSINYTGNRQAIFLDTNEITLVRKDGDEGSTYNNYFEQPGNLFYAGDRLSSYTFESIDQVVDSDSITLDEWSQKPKLTLPYSFTVDSIANGEAKLTFQKIAK